MKRGLELDKVLINHALTTFKKIYKSPTIDRLLVANKNVDKKKLEDMDNRGLSAYPDWEVIPLLLEWESLGLKISKMLKQSDK